MARPKKNTASRLDPAPRPIDGGIPYFNVLNKDPGREYVWVYKAAQEFGVEHYSYQGYRIERYTDAEGPRPAMAPVDLETGLPIKPNGTVIESRGNVLMSISKEQYEEIYQNGPDGVSGQRAADAQQRRMLDPSKQMKDAFRGINPRSRDEGKKLDLEFDKDSLVSIPVGDE
jgi:hypothetical protein